MHADGHRVLPHRRAGDLAGFALAGVLRGHRRAGANSRCDFKDLQTQARLRPRRLRTSRPDLAWANDNRTLLYVEKDPETLLGLYVKKHVLGEDPSAMRWYSSKPTRASTPAFPNPNPTHSFFIHMESTLSSEWRYARADDPQLQFEIFLTARARP